jgi:hypothetical protein
MTIRKENTMKTKFRRILAAVMATATMATGVGSLTANAESLPLFPLRNQSLHITLKALRKFVFFLISQ